MSVGPPNKVFSTLDSISGYWQVSLDNKSKELMVFSTSSGHFCFKKMLFGISGTPLASQRLINSVCEPPCRRSHCMDDIKIVSKDIDSHLNKFRGVFSRFKSAGLTIKRCEYKFLQKTATDLGHVLDKKGVNTTQEKVVAVSDYPTPTDLKVLRSFLGLSGYYLSFIKRLLLARRLTQLLN